MKKATLFFTGISACLQFFTARAQTPTWSEDVACIVYSHCTTCHHEGGAAHFSLTTFTDAYYSRNDVKAATELGYMPPWPPDPNYRSLAHERVLTQEEIDIIGSWVDGGAPEGDPLLAPPVPIYANASQIPQPDLTTIMEDYVVPPSSSDLYRCFVLDIDNPTDQFITKLEVVPGNRPIVHHVLVFQDTSGQAQVLDDEDIEPGYTNFGGIGVNSAKLIGIWVPGSDALETPSGMGIKLFAGADLVIQVHYPALSTVELDSTRVNIQFGTAPFMRELAIDPVLDHVVTITDGPLVIAPNEVRTFHAQYTAPIAATITAIGPHSHLLGKRMKAYAIPPGGDTIPLIDIPKWDFRWQGMYQFRHPIYLPAGTVLYGEADYDNTADNLSNPNSPPDWVWLGEATTNEMMLFYFAYAFGIPSDENIVVDDALHAEHYQDCDPAFQVGVEELQLVPALGAWPIPASDFLSVATYGRKGVVRLLDISGRAIMQESASSDVVRFNVADIARGVYFIELVSKQGSAPQRVKVLLE